MHKADAPKPMAVYSPVAVKKELHPSLKAHGQKVKTAHAQLSAKMPHFRQMSPTQQMQAVQRHIRRAMK